MDDLFMNVDNQKKNCKKLNKWNKVEHSSMSPNMLVYFE
jgi:hypothetical protein